MTENNDPYKLHQKIRDLERIIMRLQRRLSTAERTIRTIKNNQHQQSNSIDVLNRRK